MCLYPFFIVELSRVDLRWCNVRVSIRAVNRVRVKVRVSVRIGHKKHCNTGSLFLQHSRRYCSCPSLVLNRQYLSSDIGICKTFQSVPTCRCVCDASRQSTRQRWMSAWWIRMWEWQMSSTAVALQRYWWVWWRHGRTSVCCWWARHLLCYYVNIVVLTDGLSLIINNCSPRLSTHIIS